VITGSDKVHAFVAGILLKGPMKNTVSGFVSKEFKVVSLREFQVASPLLDNPEKVSEYWRANIQTHPFFNPECECFVVLILNTRRRIKGHAFVSVGTVDTILVHPREVFRTAIISAGAAIVLCHNHPSGDSTPSEADIKVTRDLIRAGQLLKMEVLDHVVIGIPLGENSKGYHSLRELGYFYS
jgi:DNA repair protein RadC